MLRMVAGATAAAVGLGCLYATLVGHQEQWRPWWLGVLAGVATAALVVAGMLLEAARCHREDWWGG